MKFHDDEMGEKPRKQRFDERERSYDNPNLSKPNLRASNPTEPSRETSKFQEVKPNFKALYEKLAWLRLA